MFSFLKFFIYLLFDSSWFSFSWVCVHSFLRINFSFLSFIFLFVLYPSFRFFLVLILNIFYEEKRKKTKSETKEIKLSALT